MSENPSTPNADPYDAFLTEKLASLRQAHPEHPLPMHRMNLIAALRDEAGLTPKEAMAAVDACYQRNGLAIPAPTLKGYVVAIAGGLVVILGPLGLLFWLWQYLAHR